MVELNKNYNENCLDTMARMKDNFIDLTVTSPPYDDLRDYNGYSFNFESIAKELHRVTKEGGVVVWIVGDATKKGSESLTSFKQALYFKEIGFNVHDTMIWKKKNYIPLTHNRYEQSFEYCFILHKPMPDKIIYSKAWQYVNEKIKGFNFESELKKYYKTEGIAKYRFKNFTGFGNPKEGRLIPKRIYDETNLFLDDYKIYKSLVIPNIKFNAITEKTLNPLKYTDWSNCKSYGKNHSKRKRNEITKSKEYKIKSNVWELATASSIYSNTAPFPEKLANDHIISWSNENDLIYDPFMGSGTTAKMAIINNRNWIGSEMSSEYCEIIKERINLNK
tara:strand:+ start:39 stop:1040 length:1002 start_codon:yes stop_codon:yes gene_type:complete